MGQREFRTKVNFRVIWLATGRLKNQNSIMVKDPDLDRYLDEIAEHNRSGLRLRNSDAVSVGSFWFTQEPGKGPGIFYDHVFVPTGETDGQYILCYED
jgi:hypothetical protein